MYLPFIQNTLTQDAFKFIRKCIYFSVSAYQKRQGKHGYDPLFKVGKVMDLVINGLCMFWIAGERITIDGSMIICFVQYMPCKPIKHDVKVFAVCCT